MKNTTIARSIVGTIAGIIIGISMYNTHSNYFAEPKWITTNEGIVDRKFTGTSYRCGSKNRYDCTPLYLEVNGMANNVDEETYNKAVIGKHIVIGHEDKSITWIDFFALMISLAFVMSIAFFIVVCLWYFIEWGIFHSNEMTVKEFFITKGLWYAN